MEQWDWKMDEIRSAAAVSDSWLVWEMIGVHFSAWSIEESSSQSRSIRQSRNWLGSFVPTQVLRCPRWEQGHVSGSGRLVPNEESHCGLVNRKPMRMVASRYGSHWSHKDLVTDEGPDSGWGSPYRGLHVVFPLKCLYPSWILISGPATSCCSKECNNSTPSKLRDSRILKGCNWKAGSMRFGVLFVVITFKYDIECRCFRASRDVKSRDIYCRNLFLQVLDSAFIMLVFSMKMKVDEKVHGYC